jgi:hypothetical protein
MLTNSYTRSILREQKERNFVIVKDIIGPVSREEAQAEGDVKLEREVEIVS